MWTQDNTEGYTDTDIGVLNGALDTLAAEFEDIDPANLNDLLSAAWTAGADIEMLVCAVRARLTK